MKPRFKLTLLRQIAHSLRQGDALMTVLRHLGMEGEYSAVRRALRVHKLPTRPTPGREIQRRYAPSERAQQAAAAWNKGATIPAIAMEAGVSKQAISKALQSAERHGLLTRPTVKTSRAANREREWP